MKKFITLTTLLTTMLGGLIFGEDVLAAETASGKTTVTVKVVSGGITATVPSTATISATIGTAVPAVALNIPVVNLTGSAGYTITVADSTTTTDATGMVLTYTPSGKPAITLGKTAATAFTATTVTTASQANNGSLGGSLPATAKTGTATHTVDWVITPKV